MDVIQKPSRDELRSRAADLVPVLRANALWSERNRRLSDDTVQAMTDAGIFRLRTPERFGGYACDTRTLVDVGIELGRGDGSAAFNAAAWWIMSWNVGMFPDEVQEEVFTTPDVRICGTLAPTATAVSKDGGIVVSGQWNFNSGAAHSQWKLVPAILPDGEGGAEPILAIAPMSPFEVVDDWDVSGLRGTGSVTVRVEDLFIPTAKYLKISALMRQQYASERNRDLPIYRGPMVGAVSSSTTGKIVGLARAAREAFLERLPGRAISNTAYTRQIEAPVTHLQVADAALKIDEAEYHARRLAEMVDEKGLRAEPWSLEERAYARMAVGRVCQLCLDAVNIFTMASGASSIYSSVPIQRIQRDMQTIALHALNLPNTNLELYGRILCGQEPNTFFV